MARFDLTDFDWSVIEPLLPTKVRGVPRVDDRRVLNGILWRKSLRSIAESTASATPSRASSTNSNVRSDDIVSIF